MIYKLKYFGQCILVSATYFEMHQKKRCFDGSIGGQRYDKASIFDVNFRIQVVDICVITVELFQAFFI